MKAEHRKELHTNALADSMGRLMQGVRTSPKATSAALWVIAIVALATSVAWYFTSGTSRNRSALWVQVEDASYVKDPLGPFAEQELEDVVKESPGSMPGRTARFQRARLLLPQGLQSVATDRRKEALRDIETGRDLYEKLATECADDALLRQEALWGAAQGEEALIGATKEDSSAPLGSFDKAVELYKRLADSYPDGYLGQKAKAHVKELEENRAQVEKFYAELNKLASSAATTAKP